MDVKTFLMKSFIGVQIHNESLINFEPATMLQSQRFLERMEREGVIFRAADTPWPAMESTGLFLTNMYSPYS